ncbi:hypothetical protein POSPLADRAFT_1047941 [Postia placenta MAD-698-R-SB12]|uniref:Uncharacterized protein n=1 Tax=Postia placenta MAD-698-R-SB12 TaxID=670580 RepID=A0A1X6MW98_9APHY|nr:hypothetical protein POSPLADRAFT_1047941 [Postia placenta MAD-698-R-SB12]OSX60512.1 hypothetical protein POSPLADRAFT_1047941 [Postia placenta MAD-698-R-SB12]
MSRMSERQNENVGVEGTSDVGSNDVRSELHKVFGNAESVQSLHTAAGATSEMSSNEGWPVTSDTSVIFSIVTGTITTIATGMTGYATVKPFTATAKAERAKQALLDLETFVARINPLERMTIEGNVPGFMHTMEAFAGAAGLHTQWVSSWLGNQLKADLETANVEVYRKRVDLLVSTRKSSSSQLELTYHLHLPTYFLEAQMYPLMESTGPSPKGECQHKISGSCDTGAGHSTADPAEADMAERLAEFNK